MNTSRSLLERQLKMARYMLLGTVIITVVNLALLLGNASFYIPYFAALPYYLAWFGKVFDNNFSTVGTEIGEFTHTGLFLCFIVLAVLLVLWWLGRRSERWLKVGMGVLIADVVVLVALAFFVFGNVMSFLMEILLHCAVIWEIWQGVKAQEQLAIMPEEPIQVSDDWNAPNQEDPSAEEQEKEEEYV